MNISLIFQVVGMFILPLAVVLIPIYIGEKYGAYYSSKNPNLQQVPIDLVVSVAFGLLAFMLGFTFQIAANRFESRKQMLIEEVKDIRTTYLRAGLVPEPFKSNTRKYLVEYTDLRVEVSNDMSKVDKVIKRSRVILDTLWNYTESLAVQDRSSEVYSLYTTAVNDMVDVYNERVILVFVYRVPRAVMWALFIMVVLSMFSLGYQFGVAGRGSPVIIFLLAMTFAVVMFLISALDHPNAGLVKLDQQPLMTLQEELQQMENRTVNKQLMKNTTRFNQ